MSDTRVALVTGGGGGIGGAICRSLAGAGAKVAVADIAMEPAERLAAEIGTRSLVAMVTL